jgi:ADP-heptose:LPS heptosyltransferase
MPPLQRPRSLAVRSDSIGDVLLAEPALRAMAARSDLTLLCSPHGRPVVDILAAAPRPMVFDAPWISADPPPIDARAFSRLVRQLASARFDSAVIFTSDRQSALPMALALRLAGVPLIGAHSDHYPGSLLDVRLRPRRSEVSGADPEHEVERNLRLAEAMGFPPPADRRMRVVGAYPPASTDDSPYVVVHAGAAAAARTPSPARWTAVVRALIEAGHRVVLTGAADDHGTHVIADAVPEAVRLVGATSLRQLVPVIERASAVCVGNTGIMHLAAAVGTPVVALFPPTVPMARWRPWAVPHVVLGAHELDCAPCYLRDCRFADHPCCEVAPTDVVAAVAAIGGRPSVDHVEVGAAS